MGKTLIVATTSYAGMGPYVTGIVNTFNPNDGIYSYFHDNEDDFFRKNVKPELLSQSYFYRSKNSNWNKLKDLVTAKLPTEKQILRICREKEIKLVHFINGPVSEGLAVKFNKMGIEVLGTVHDLHPHEAKKALHKMLRHRILSKRTLAAIDYDMNLATNSPSQLEELKKLYPDKNIFFYDFPSLISPEVKNGKDIPLELSKLVKPYILFFGRIEEYKGIELLYKAFVESKEIKRNYALVIAGGGSISFEHINDAENNVLFINRYIKDSEVRYLYEHAVCVVYPYISATQSGVLSVAYYFGTPVIASDVPFFKGIIEPSHAGILFTAGDVDDLKAKLAMLLQNDKKELAEVEHEYYIKHYGGTVIRQQLLSIYSQILDIKSN